MTGAAGAGELELVAVLAVCEAAAPAADTLGGGFPLFVDGGFFTPLGVPGPALLLGVTPEIGLCDGGALETWVCGDAALALLPVVVGVLFAGAEVPDGEFAGVVLAGAEAADAGLGAGVGAAASVAAVVASSSAAKG